jgi:hypothetical protein
MKKGTLQKETKEILTQKKEKKVRNRVIPKEIKK